MIVGVQAIQACFDVEQHRFAIPSEVFEAHLQAYDTLLRYPVSTDPGGYRTADMAALEPALIESGDVSADERTYSFRLRRGVRSAAGNELTAHDVRWAWERAFALDSWSSRIARFAGIASPEAIRVVQPHVAQFKIEQPNSLFPRILAVPFPPIYDLEEVHLHCSTEDRWGERWLGGHSSGFGPYALQEVLATEEATLAANPRYWQGAAREKRVLLRALPSSKERAATLARGSLDVAAELPADELRRLASCSGVRITSFAGGRQVVLRLDPAFAPFEQPRVRQALAMALPYEEISQQVFGGPAARAPDTVSDQRGARELLRQAGYSSGFRVSLALPQDNPELLAIAQLFQLDAMRLGLKVVLEPTNPAVFAREKASRHLPAYLEDRVPLTADLSFSDLDPLSAVHTIVIAQPLFSFAARTDVEGFVRRSDGRPRYWELRKL